MVASGVLVVIRVPCLENKPAHNSVAVVRWVMQVAAAAKAFGMKTVGYRRAEALGPWRRPSLLLRRTSMWLLPSSCSSYR